MPCFALARTSAYSCFSPRRRGGNFFLCNASARKGPPSHPSGIKCVVHRLGGPQYTPQIMGLLG